MKSWALRRKAHTFECAGCRRQTSVTAGTILHASKLAHRLILGRLPDGDPLHGILPCSSRNSRYRLLPQRLAAAPTSCAPAWSTPNQPVVGPARPASCIPSSHRRARTQSHRRRSNSGTETSQAACGWPKSACCSYGAADLGHFVERAKTDGWSGYAAVPAEQCHVVEGRSPRPAVDPPSLLQPQRMGARRLPRAASTSICRPISEFVFRFNRRQNPPRCPLALPPRHQCKTPYLQHVDRTGAMCISGKNYFSSPSCSPSRIRS